MGIPQFQILLGGQCLGCGTPLVRPDPVWQTLCAPCAAALPWITEQRCEVCSLPLVSEQERCVRCRTREYAFAWHRAAFLYADLPEALVHAFKFGQHRSLAEPLAWALAAAASEAMQSVDLLVPVPGNPRRARTRGWSPTVLLSHALSRRTGIPSRCLIRRTAGQDQKELTYEGRVSTVSRRYRISRAGRTAGVWATAGKTICLIDDVFTTGATVSACAEVLKRAGAASVCAVTLAID